MEHIRDVIRRSLPRKPARTLAPLDPDRFLRWAYDTMPGRRAPWESPLTLDDLAFEMDRHGQALSRDELRRSYVRMAARVRRNQRLGRDPWEGVR